MNHRSVSEILDMVLLLSSMVGASERGAALVESYEQRILQIKDAATNFEHRPRVYFEEWDEPMISAIRWVSELVNIAGGEDCFAELGMMPMGKDRIIADAARVIDANPDVIIGSWCGKKFRPEKVSARPGWDAINAVRHGRLFEIKSPNILQPGPAALTDGLDQLHKIMLDFNKSK